MTFASDRFDPGSVSPYDLLLALVPLALLAGVGGASLLGASPSAGVAAGGLSAALIVGYGLFYRTPVRRGPSPRSGRDERSGRSGAAGPGK